MGSNTSIYEPVDDNNYVLNSITQIDNSSSRSVHFTDESFDSFTLIWLDVQSKGNDLESLKTKNLLLQICKDCLFYENCDLFFNDINQRKFANKKALLIVSGSFVNIISTYNVRNNISAAIIFCRYRYNYEHLRDTFIVDICTDRKSLKNSITYEMSSLKLNLFENQPLKSVQSLTENNINNGVYYKYLLFIELLKQMPQTDQAKETMLKKSEDYYRTQEASLKQIDEFRQSYTFDKALKWYTRDTFVYRLVNLAFRTEDITLWYIFRFYITDLCRQLEKIYREQEENFGHRRLILYRGQSRISTKELEDIKSSIGGLVATTGFFSTSFDEEVAGKFVLGASTTHDYAPVFFEIVVDTNNTKNLIFADVFKSLSAQKESNILVAGEREILFNIGSVFKITNVYYHTNKSLWYITMEGTDEGTSLVKNQIKLIIEKFQIQNMNLLFGKHILNMGYYSAAECYFQQMLQELPKNHKDIPLIYHFIGDIKMRITNWNEALTNFNRAYMLKRKSHSGKHPDFAITWNNIGNYHIAIGNYDLALLSYQNSLKYVKDSFNIAITKLNIASILIMNGQYLQALEVCRESLCLLQQIEPCPKGEFVRCHGLIGDIHHAQQEYDDAEASYLCAFAIAKKYLLMNDRRLIKCIEALAIIYQKQDNNNNNRSIDFCREYLLLYQKDLSENHISIAYILMILGKLSDKIDYYERALSIFEKTISQEYASTANCLMLVAKYYDEQKLYEKALSFYMRAYEIQTKIYPLNHSLIVESSKILSVIERKLKRQPTK